MAREKIISAESASLEEEQFNSVLRPTSLDECIGMPEVLEKLRSGELDLKADVAEDVQLQVERPTIFVLYEQNVGMLTPMITEELRDAEKHFPTEWISDAFLEAVARNKRNWRYVLAVLERWRTQGKDVPRTRSEIPADSKERRRHYVPEGYEDLVEH